MGLLKRDLARASAKSVPELGGAFCPPTAPLHVQEHASSLQPLAKGCRETLLLPTSSVLRNVATLRPWQVTNSTAALPHTYTRPSGQLSLPHISSPLHTPLPLCVPILKHHQPFLQNLGPHTDVLKEF